MSVYNNYALRITNYALNKNLLYHTVNIIFLFLRKLGVVAGLIEFGEKFRRRTTYFVGEITDNAVFPRSSVVVVKLHNVRIHRTKPSYRFGNVIFVRECDVDIILTVEFIIKIPVCNFKIRPFYLS